MNLFVALLDLFFPPCCAICRERVMDKDLLCAACQETVLDVKHCCDRCGHPLAGEHKMCNFCHEQAFAFHRACAVSLYQGKLKAAIHRFKYGGRKELALPFGHLIAAQVKTCEWPQMQAIVPIPLHQKRLQQRGYDQSLLLAQVIGGELQLPVMRLLERQHDTVSQTTLSAQKRWENACGAFRAVSGIDMPRTILLVDDLLTTGATAHFAARSLQMKGACDVYLAVIGRP